MTKHPWPHYLNQQQRIITCSVKTLVVWFLPLLAAIGAHFTQQQFSRTLMNILLLLTWEIHAAYIPHSISQHKCLAFPPVRVAAHKNAHACVYCTVSSSNATLSIMTRKLRMCTFIQPITRLFYLFVLAHQQDVSFNIGVVQPWVETHTTEAAGMQRPWKHCNHQQCMTNAFLLMIVWVQFPPHNSSWLNACW